MNHLTNHHYKFRGLHERLKEQESIPIDSGDVIVQTFETGIRYLEDLINYLRGEVGLLEERHQLSVFLTTGSVTAAARSHFYVDQFKFLREWFVRFEQVVFQDAGRCQLNMPVKEVLYLIRLLRDDGLLEKDELKFTYRFLGNHFKTAQQERLSVESLRKKYSQLDKRVMHDTTALLARLVELNKAYLLSAKAGSI